MWKTLQYLAKLREHNGCTYIPTAKDIYRLELGYSWNKLNFSSVPSIYTHYWWRNSITFSNFSICPPYPCVEFQVLKAQKDAGIPENLQFVQFALYTVGALCIWNSPLIVGYYVVDICAHCVTVHMVYLRLEKNVITESKYGSFQPLQKLFIDIDTSYRMYTQTYHLSENVKRYL